MEGTGVTDRNGREIKKFDIVDFIVEKWSNGTYVVVKRGNDYWLLDLDDTDQPLVPLAGKLTGELEVMGGVYEASNPTSTH